MPESQLMKLQKLQEYLEQLFINALKNLKVQDNLWISDGIKSKNPGL